MSAGGREAQLDVAPYVYDLTYGQVLFGGGLYWLPRPAQVPLRPSIGVRVSGVWFWRDFEDEGARDQSLVTVMPGVSVGLGVALGRRLTLGVEGRLHYLLHRADGVDRSLGTIEALARLDWRFR